MVEDEQVASVCTGCGCCMNICPTEAIHMEYNISGYLKPVIDKGKCIQCGKCVDLCPAIHHTYPEYNMKEPICYAIWAKDDIRMNSSSGGFFTILAQYVFDKGGYVYGAVWKEDFICEIVEASCEKELAPMRYSKYVQSGTKDTYKNVEKRLKQNKLVLYIGCPCQIAGLNVFLNEKNICVAERKNLITVDLVCFCAPSNLYFKKYLEEEYGISNVAAVYFRDKSSMGWSPVSYKIELKDGSVVYPDSSDDPYQRAFHGVLARRKTCENCKYYTFPRQGDFTMGDFWGIERHDPTWNDKKGTSVVLVNNGKASKIFESLKSQFIRWDRVPLAWCMNKGNRIGTEARPGHCRKGYFEYLIGNRSFRESVERALNGTYEIGCICMFNYNIGNNLTNYALYRVLTDMGYSVLMIGNPKLEGKIAFGCSEDRFKRFKAKPYQDWAVLPPVGCKEELYDLNEKCEMFIVASDQLWRKEFLDLMDQYTTLDWVESKKYKVSYATSFGTDSFEENERDRQKFGYLLNRFQDISVREKSGSILVQKLADRKAEVVLDPVFLCEKSVYVNMADTGTEKLPDGKYVAAYFLDKTKEKENALLGLSNSMTNGRYRAITDFPEAVFDESMVDYMNEPAIEEWLAMIKGCEIFLTDSFHGICFALIFEKQFAVIYDKENWRGYTRIYGILEKYGLLDRYVSGDKEILIALAKRGIDYSKVNELLDRECEFSRTWLISALKKRKEFCGKYDIYDEIIEREANAFKREREIYRQGEKLLSKIQLLGSKQFLRQYAVKRVCNNPIRKKEGEKMTVVGFGAGNCFYRNIAKIRQVYDLRIVCDNDFTKWDCEIESGITCISPSKLKEIDDVLVIIMVDDIGIAFEIAEQLIDMGIIRFTHISNWLKAIEC